MSPRFVAALALVLAACGGGETPSPDAITSATPLPTVPGVGELPDTVPTPDVAADASLAVSVIVTRPVDEDGVAFDTVAESVNGNRVIAIGDSILASTATRYGGELCESLTELGWSVEVDAEPGRSVHFGNRVLRQRITENTPEDEDFDAAIVHLGSNYGNDRDDYFEELNEILFRLAPRPTLLLTVTEYRPAWAEVNSVIDELSALYDNVIVIDWEQIARTPGVLSGDGLHPGAQGEAVLVEQLAVALGRTDDTPGECLPSNFTDDSAVRGGSTSGGSTSGGSTSGGSTSTSRGSTSGGTSSTSGGSTSGGSTTETTTVGSTIGGSTTETTTVGSTTETTTVGSTIGGSTTETTTETTVGSTTETTTETTVGSTTETTTVGSTSGGSTTETTVTQPVVTEPPVATTAGEPTDEG